MLCRNNWISTLLDTLVIIHYFLSIISGQIDTSGRFTKGFTVKALFGTLLAMLYDENTQVNGIMFMFDMTGYEMRHIRFFSIEDNKNFAKLWQVCP